MFKRRNKRVGEDHRYIFISHHDEGVGQWDLSKRQLLAIVGLCIAIVGSGLFITTKFSLFSINILFECDRSFFVALYFILIFLCLLALKSIL